MANDENISTYFGSYSRKSPARNEYVAHLRIPESFKGYSEGFLKEHLNAKGTPLYIDVTPDNYPKLYTALTEECAFRGIERPACYINTESKRPLAYAEPSLEAIFFTPETYEKMSKQELRAVVAHEVKHLYSGLPKCNREMREIEKDCDRASVESTNYATMQSFFHKAVAMMADQKVPVPVFRNFVHRIHETLPNIIAENFWLRLDSKHPSPARRMHEMQKHEQAIKPGLSR